MKLHFLTIPAQSPQDAQQQLNGFLAQHRILNIEKHFVAIEMASYWSICITYLEGAGGSDFQLNNKRSRIDYKEVLSEQDFAVYAELRNLRKEIAQQEGVPAYALLYHYAVCAHIRYMDDIVWWCTNKACARQVLTEFRAFVTDDCKLRLKPQSRLNASRHGLSYCGFRIFPGTIRLTQRKQRKYRMLRQGYENAWLRGQLEDRELQSVYDAILAATLPAESRSWRQRDLHLHPSLYENEFG